MLFDKSQKKYLIAGPCALESRDQLRHSTQFLKSQGVKIIRSCLWKPRTKPGWDGIGSLGIDILLEEVLAEGLIPASEIISSSHAAAIIEGVMRIDPNACVLLWLGARNQAHFEQRMIGKILSEGPPNIYLMFKNQMWEDINHWLGIAEHILESGFPKDRLSSCHRGFAPSKYCDNPLKFRNLPDFEMAMAVKEKLGIPMFFDPSHTGGCPENIAYLTEQSLAYEFDGYLVEVHPSPEKALTDAKQQLNQMQFVNFLRLINKELVST